MKTKNIRVMVNFGGSEGTVARTGHMNGASGTHILFLDRGDGYRGVHLIVIHLSTHWFCLVFCICIFFVSIKICFKKARKHTPLR